MAEREKKPTIDAALWEEIEKTEREMTPPPGFDIEALVAQSSRTYWAAKKELLQPQDGEVVEPGELTPVYLRVIEKLNLARFAPGKLTREIWRDALMAVAPMFFISVVIFVLWASGDTERLQWVLPVCAAGICLATFALIYKFVRMVNSPGRFSLLEQSERPKSFMEFVYNSGGAMVGGTAGVVLLTVLSLQTSKDLSREVTEKQSLARSSALEKQADAQWSARKVATDTSREVMAQLQNVSFTDGTTPSVQMPDLPAETEVTVEIAPDEALSVKREKIAPREVRQTITAKPSTKDVFPDTYVTILSDFEGTLYKSEGEAARGEELLHYYVGRYDKLADGKLHFEVFKTGGDARNPVVEEKSFSLHQADNQDGNWANIANIKPGQPIFVTVDAKTNEVRRAVPFPAAKRNALFKKGGAAATAADNNRAAESAP